ncbi:MAG: DNA methyltransferase [Cycloclasticus sp.]
MSQLNLYTKKNTFDYFIHKNLGEFLTRELDFYIKNELFRWEDISNMKSNPARLAPLLSKIEVIRTIGEKIITFLAQLEDFQKKLWLKKKFVTETNYCITLDRLAEEPDLLAEIIVNEAQRQQWQNLVDLDLKQLDKDIEAGDWIAQDKYRYLMVDTALFDDVFKAHLLAQFDDLDEQCDGVLINSDNFQALNLLQKRYKGSLNCLYADPPYNAKSSEILYKNQFKHSSWISMMDSRIVLAKQLKSENGALITAIDENEFNRLSVYFSSAHPELNIDNITIVHNPAGVQGYNFSYSHEYAIYGYNHSKNIIGQTIREEPSIEAFRDWGGTSSRSLAKNCFYPILVKGEKIIGFGDVCADDFHPGESNLVEDGLTSVYPIADDGEERKWVFARDSVEKIKDNLIVKEKDGVISISRLKTETSYKTTWSGNKFYANIYGSKLLNNMLGGKLFDFPKSLYTIKECLWAVNSFRDKKSICLDYYSGSGTTGHAVIQCNREDGGSRKYILIEMGAYFDTVVKPRIQKAVYSENWKAGKPSPDDDGNLNGISHCFKYLRLESYEDTLANLQLKRTPVQNDLLSSNSADEQSARESYLLNYMLNVETQGSASLLDISKFIDPTAYQLKVRNPTGDETKLINVDLLETFNWLLGLTVEHINAPIYFTAELKQADHGRWQADVKRQADGKWWFRTVAGTNRKGQKILIVWRNLPSVIANEANEANGLVMDNAVLDAVLIDKLSVRMTESQDDEFDILYVNGDHNITIPKNRQGGLMESRVKLIEEDFHRLMFSSIEH